MIDIRLTSTLVNDEFNANVTGAVDADLQEVGFVLSALINSFAKAAHKTRHEIFGILTKDMIMAEMTGRFEKENE